MVKISILALLVMVACNEKQVDLPNAEILLKSDTMFYQKKLFSGLLLEKYQNGKIHSKKRFKNGLLEGKQLVFSESGSVLESREYSNNRKNGRHAGWWPNRKPKFDFQIIDDIPVGEHKEWFESGQLYSLSNFNVEGQPEGRQQLFFSNGQIQANFVIKNGRRFGFLGAKGCMGEGERKQTGFK